MALQVKAVLETLDVAKSEEGGTLKLDVTFQSTICYNFLELVWLIVVQVLRHKTMCGSFLWRIRVGRCPEIHG